MKFAIKHLNANVSIGHARAYFLSIVWKEVNNRSILLASLRLSFFSSVQSCEWQQHVYDLKRQKRCLASLIRFTFQIIWECFIAFQCERGPYNYRNKKWPTRIKPTFSTDFHKGIHHPTKAYLAIRYREGVKCPQLLLLISESWQSELYLVQWAAKSNMFTVTQVQSISKLEGTIRNQCNNSCWYHTLLRTHKGSRDDSVKWLAGRWTTGVQFPATTLQTFQSHRLLSDILSACPILY